MSKRKRTSSLTPVEVIRTDMDTSRSSMSFAADEEFPKADQPYDLILFLAVAQYFMIEFLPVTWPQALGSLGEGGAAEVRQSPIDIQRSFAFKCIKRPEDDITTASYRVLVSELSILANPIVEVHPHIVTLLGVSWDVIDETAWPVLVFEKAQFGNLKDFMRMEAGSALCYDKRVKLCAGVAAALRDMHSSGGFCLPMFPISDLIPDCRNHPR
jgi:hypothetical protein